MSTPPSPLVHNAAEPTFHPSKANPADATSPWPVFFIASVAVFLVSIDATVLFAAFPALRQSFSGATAADVSWVINAYTVVYAALLVPAGRLADTRGRRRMFMVGISLFTVASLACGLAPNVGTLVAARVVQAAGAAMLTPASLSIILAAFPLEKRAVAVSLWGAVSGLAAAVGPSLGSWVVDNLGWQWAFFINLPPALWSLHRAWTKLPIDAESDRRGQVDWIGVALLIAGMGGLTWGVVHLETHPWHSASILAGWMSGAALLAVFIAWARRHPQPAVDLRLFLNPTYRAVNVATLIFGTAFAMMFFGFFFFMTGIWHYSLPLAGLAMTPGPLMVVPSAMVAGRIAAKAGHRPVLVTGCLLVAAGGLWQSFVPGVDPHYLTHWLPSQLMTGIGVGLALPSLSGAAVASLGPAHFGVGSAVNQAVRQFGSVLGVSLTVVLLGKEAITLTDYQTVSLSFATLALLAAAICLAVNTRPNAR